MKIIFRIVSSLFALLLICAILLLGASWWLGNAIFEEQPELTTFPKASLEDMQRIKSLALQASTQGNLETSRTLLLSERDINLGIATFGPTQVKIPKSTYANVDLSNSSVRVTITLPAKLLHKQAEQIPELQTDTIGYLYKKIKAFSTGKWINASLDIRIDGNKPKDEWLRTGKIRIGDLTLSQSLSDRIIQLAYQNFRQHRQSKIAMETWNNINGLNIRDEQLQIDFTLPNNQQALASYQALVLSPDEQSNIEHYSQFLSKQPSRGPLASILAALFTEATTRANASLDPVGENRAALLALSKKYGGDKLLMMLDAGQGITTRNTPSPYTIYNRRDLAQHYVLSAGLALIANQNLAELVGLDKEIADLVGGKTISAWDLLADKAGVRLAENATLSAKSARQVQLALSKARRDSHLLPDLAREFEFSDDRFDTSELEELELLIELYLEQHPLLQKRS